jgi:PilZ domain
MEPIMETLSKIIMLVSDHSSLALHKSMLEDMGSKIIHITQPDNDLKTLSHTFDLIIIDYSCSCGKQLASIFPESFKQINCIILVACEAEQQEAKNLFQHAEIIMKPVAPDQLNQKVAELFILPSRRPIKILIRMQLIDEPKAPFALGTMIDISENGMLVETEKQLRVDTHIKISFYLSETGGFVELAGQIIRERKAVSPKMKCYGIRFLKVETQFQDKIDRFILKLKSRKI